MPEAFEFISIGSYEQSPLMMELPKPMFDVKDYLPEGVTPELNGMIPVHLMQKVPCGGQLCIDAARAWNAMVRAAYEDNVFLNLNHPLNTYKNLLNQRTLFQIRFAKLDSPADAARDRLCVEFDNAIWQLRADKEFVECPGVNTHGYALAVFIVNGMQEPARSWLDKNAADFGFVREYDFIPGRFVYIKSREAIPQRVLEIENLPPYQKYPAAQIIKYSGCKWLKTPPADWYCTGIFHSEPCKLGAMVVIDQGSGIGMSDKMLEVLNRQCKAVVCTEPTDVIKNSGMPVLISTNLKETVDKLMTMFETVPPENPSDEVTLDVASNERLNFYRKVNPEAVIFERKKKIAKFLLDIPFEDVKDAPSQSWYKEYHALLSIRLKNPALINLGRQFCDELMQWYKLRPHDHERELAVLGFIQFLDPTELTVPFNHHIWHKDLITDVNGVFTHQFTRAAYTDEDIITYYLARQQNWKHGKRKMRIVFILHSVNKAEKMMPVFEAFQARDDVEISLVVHPSSDYKYGDFGWNYFRNTFPNAKVYGTTTLFDVRKLKPDYVFYRTPYDFRRRFGSFMQNDTIRFAKLCNISYGATLAHTFVDRLLDEFPTFYRSLYFMFCSSPTVKKKFEERYPSNAEMGYQHFEFPGYPVVDKDPLPMDEHSKKTILWTPRWSYEPRLGGSHFLEYKDNFVELRQRYGDKVNLSMRPHENTFRDLQEKKLITAEEIDAYKKSLTTNDIKLYSTTYDLDEQFRITDILLADYSSILIVYFLTGRPIIYCEFAGAVPFDEYKEMFECMYIAHSWDDVLKYLDDLIAGNDPLYERRQKVVAELRAMHEGSVRNIVNLVVEDFKSCEDDSIDERIFDDERWF